MTLVKFKPDSERVPLRRLPPTTSIIRSNQPYPGYGPGMSGMSGSGFSDGVGQGVGFAVGVFIFATVYAGVKSFTK